jgi:tetratricopeptide (TPR) repeat protein
MGRVYKAHDRLTGEWVAFKRIRLAQWGPAAHDSAGRGDPLRLSLTQEFQTLAALRHPHIVRVRDFGFDLGSQPYFTMEWLGGGAQTRVDAGFDQPLEFQVALLVQLLQALLYVHRRGLVHRDLKPGNVAVVEGQVKLLDFGLAAGAGHETAAGSLPYLAPELLDRQPITLAADLYGVGALAYEMFTGRPPFIALDDTEALFEKIRSAEPRLARVPEPVRPVVARLLAKKPGERYAHAGEVVAALSAAMGQALAVETRATRESFLQAAQFVGREAKLQGARQMLEDLGHKFLLSRALFDIGTLLIETGRAGEAVEYFQESLKLRRETDEAPLIMESLAGLASAAFTLGNVTQARTYVDEILTWLEGQPANIMDDPFRVYLTCYRILSATGSPRAGELLDSAYQQLQARAAKIEDEALRHSCLENVATHRELAAAWQAMQPGAGAGGQP